MYEIITSEGRVNILGEFTSNNPQSSLAMLPKRNCNVGNCEFAKFLKLSNTTIETLSFYVPRKVSEKITYVYKYHQDTQVFHDDLFPPALSGEPALTASEWIEGKSSGNF